MGIDSDHLQTCTQRKEQKKKRNPNDDSLLSGRLVFSHDATSDILAFLLFRIAAEFLKSHLFSNDVQ